MVIRLDPKHIASASGGAVRTGQRRATPQERDSVYTPPRRSEVNYIPAPETLATLINSAIAAFRGGVVWDRGTILNLVV